MFSFNKNYKDLEQVREFMPDFERRLNEIEGAGNYRYNDSFKGYIPGIIGPCEDTGIYLLQGLERQDRQAEKIATLLTGGYRKVPSAGLPNGTTKHADVVAYLDWQWIQKTEARLVVEHGGPSAILPKGKRTHGYRVGGWTVLVKD